MAYITHRPSKNWGLGHQLKNVWSAINLAEEFGLKYVACSPTGQGAPWTSFLNFNDGVFEPPKGLNTIDINLPHYGGNPIEEFKKIIEPHKDDDSIQFILIGNTRYSLKQLSTDKRNKVVKFLVDNYWRARETNSIPLKFDKNKINVAIHIRRGDIRKQDKGVKGKMFVDELYFLNVMNRIQETVDKEVQFYVYSDAQNKCDLIRKQTHLSVEYELGLNRNVASEFPIFHHMLNADILISSPSNFSYLVGEMSGNIVINLTRWVPWTKGPYSLTDYSQAVKKIEALEDGSFDTRQLTDYLNLPFKKIIRKEQQEQKIKLILEPEPIPKSIRHKINTRAGP